MTNYLVGPGFGVEPEFWGSAFVNFWGLGRPLQIQLSLAKAAELVAFAPDDPLNSPQNLNSVTGEPRFEVIFFDTGDHKTHFQSL